MSETTVAADPWAAFPDAPTPAASATATHTDPWAAFPDAPPDKVGDAIRAKDAAVANPSGVQYGFSGFGGVPAAPPSLGGGLLRGLGQAVLSAVTLPGSFQRPGQPQEEMPLSLGDGAYVTGIAPTSEQANDLIKKSTGIDLLRPAATESEGLGQVAGNVAANAPLMLLGGPEAAGGKLVGEAVPFAVKAGRYALGAGKAAVGGGATAFVETPGDLSERADAAKTGALLGGGLGLVLPPLAGSPGWIRQNLMKSVDVGGTTVTPANARAAGQTLSDAVGPDAGKIDQAADDLANNQFTPGYQPTLSQIMPDNAKVTGIEATARKTDDAGFTQRADQQTQSELTAIGNTAGSGDPQKVAPALQAEQGRIERANTAALDAEQQKAKQALGAAPGPAFGDQASAGGAADQHFTAPEQYGADTRASVLTSRQAAENQRAGVQGQINQDGNVVVPNGADDPIRSNIRQVYTPETMQDVSGTEAKILARVQALPDHAPLSRLGILRNQISDAIDDLTPPGVTRMPAAGRRLLTVKNAIDAAIDNSAGDIAANGPKAAPQPPAPTVASPKSPQVDGGAPSALGLDPLKGSNRQPQSLVDWIIARGGIQDPTGDLTAMGADTLHHRAGGRLINPKGAHPDYVREAAIEEGFLPADADINALYNAINEHISGRPTVRAHDMTEALERQQRDREARQEADARYEAKDRVGKAAIDQLGVRITPQELEHAIDLHLQGVDPQEAVIQAKQWSQHQALDENAARNAFGSPGMALAEQQALDIPGGGVTNPRYMTPEEAAAHQQVRRLNRQIAATYDSGTVGDLLAFGEHATNAAVPAEITRARGGFKVPDADVMPKVWDGSRNEGANIRQFVQAGGNVERLKAWAADDLRQRAVDPRSGELDVKAYEAWKQKHGAGLNSVPELRQVFDTAADAQRAVQNGAERNAQTLADFQTTVVRKFLGENPAKAVTAMFERGDSTKNLDDILRKIGSDPDANAGLRRAVGDHIGDLYTPLSKTGSTIKDDLRAADYNRFLATHQATLTRLYGQDGFNLLKQVGDQMQQRSLASSVLRSRGAPAGHAMTGGDLITAELGIEGAKHLAGLIPGGKHVVTGGLGALRLGQVFRARGIQTQGQLLNMAALNPTTVGRQLLSLTSRPDNASPMLARRLAAAIGASEAASGGSAGGSSRPTPSGQ